MNVVSDFRGGQSATAAMKGSTIPQTQTPASSNVKASMLYTSLLGFFSSLQAGNKSKGKSISETLF